MVGDDDLSRIIGHIEKDGLVTLDDCFYTKKNISFGGISKSKICISKALVGVEYEKDEAVTFNSLSFSIDCLDEWIGISGIQVDIDWENKSTTIIYNPQKSIVHKIDNGMQLEIFFAYTLPGVPHLTEAKVTQKAYFKLVSEKTRPLSEFTETAYKLTTFISFAVDATVTLKDLSATSFEIQRELDDGRKYPVPISVYYPSIPFSAKVPIRSWHDMLFCYRVIATNAQDVFNKWINSYDVMAPALSLYFSAKIGAQRYLDGKFLALAQGLETYHRRTSDEKLMNSDAFEILVASILDECPKDHLEWLQGRLMFGNEISLSTRLKRIIEPFQELFGNGADRRKMLRRIVDTRNYLTHYSEELKDRSARGRELWVICQKMEVIFQLHFLKVIGFSAAEIGDVVESCYPLKRKLRDD